MTNFRFQGQPCTLLSSRTLFGREVCTVYLPESGRVLEIGHEDLACEDSNRVLTKDEIVAVASAGKVYEALNSYRQTFGEDVLLAPLDSAVTPLPHQLDTLKRAIERVPVRRIFADEVGLGKTIEAGLVIRELKLRGLVKRILIVAPTGLAKQWVAEMKTHFEEDFQLFLPSQVEAAGELLQAARLKLAVDPQAAENPYFFSDQVVCPLDAIKPLRGRRGWTKEQVEEYNAKRFLNLLHADWDLVVIDEAHRVAGADEGVARHLLGKGLAEAAPNLLLLSATPHQGKSDAFRRLLSLVDDEAFPEDEAVTRARVQPYLIRHEKRTTVDGFGKKLFRPRHTKTLEVKWGWTEQGQRELYEQVTTYLKLGYAAMARMTKAKKVAVGFLLALLQRLATSSTVALARFLEHRQLQLEQSAQLLQDKLEDEAAAETLEELTAEEQQEWLGRLKAVVENERDQVARLVERAHKVEATEVDVKAAKLLSLVNELASVEGDPDLKVLVFTEFRSTQEMLARLFEQHGISCVSLNGNLSMEERLKCQQEFAGATRVLISTEAGGEGLNLQFCHVLINYDLPWNPMRVEQRIGRVDRIGQKQAVRAFNLVLADSVEAHVREVLEAKLSVIFAELGVDKLGDILDSGASGAIFKEVYTAGLQGGDAEEASKLAALEKALRQAARSAKEFASLYRTEAPGTELAERYLRHPFPYWVEKMMVSDCRAQGGSASRDLFGWTLSGPTGDRSLQQVVFNLEGLNTSPTARFLSVNQPEVRRVLERLVGVVTGASAVTAVRLPRLPASVKGSFYLCHVSAQAGNWKRSRLVPCFRTEGRFETTTARQVYDFLLSEDFEVQGLSDKLERGGTEELERVLEDAFAGMKELYRLEREEDYAKKQQLFKSRGRTISRIGLANVRKGKLAKLEAEQRSYEEAFRRHEQLLPGLKILLTLAVEGGAA